MGIYTSLSSQPAQYQRIEFIWGVLDMVPDTDFPDIRNKSLVHSNHGSALLVPREQDRVRVYMQLEDKDIINPATGRVDKERMGPDELLEVSGNCSMDLQSSISPLGCPKIALPL